MENPKGSTGKTDQDLKKLESSVQSYRFARPGPSDGRPHIKTTQTPALVLGWAGDDNTLKLPDSDTIRFGSINGQAVWNNAGVQVALEEISEDRIVMADRLPCCNIPKIHQIKSRTTKVFRR